MVNHGVSRGCRTCKKRRKKCDEARPSCKRCVKAQQVCLGYIEETDLIFRRYGVIEEAVQISQHPSDKVENWQSLCSLISKLPDAIDDTWVQQFALAEFLNEYCIIPEETYLSRGYLAGLETLLTSEGPFSDVAAAAKTAAFASLAKKHRDTHLSERAKTEYSKLLRSFSATMSTSETSNTLQSLTTAILLGIYEIISTSKRHPSEHEAHFRGVAAILSCKDSVFSQHPVKEYWPEDGTTSHRYDGNPLIWPNDLGMISRQSPGPSVPSLDALLQYYSPVFRKGKILTSDLDASVDDLQQFREYAIIVDQDFALWPARQPKSWQPRSLGLMDPAFRDGFLPGLTLAPGRIDVYLDLYVSSVWNSFHKCRLVLLDFICKSSHRLQLQGIDLERIPTPTEYKTHNILLLAERISEDLAASIPFHLVRNPEVLVVLPQQRQQLRIGKQEVIVPNVAVGGLLLMHIIHVVSTLSVVPQQISQSLRESLAWIGRFMGIGLAEVISDSSFSFPREFIMDGHILVSAGMMIP